MIDEQTLELIKNNQYSQMINFQEELHELIHDFYKNFYLDRQDEEYRHKYIMNFIEQHEDFIVNYVTNIYNANISTSDKLSDEITFFKFLDTLATYLTKYCDDDRQTITNFQKREA